MSGIKHWCTWLSPLTNTCNWVLKLFGYYEIGCYLLGILFAAVSCIACSLQLQGWAISIVNYFTVMGTEEPRDPLKGVDWKAVGNDMQKNPGDKPGMKKRLPKKIRQIPECYFLPRKSRLYNFTFAGACIAGGIGAGMLVEMWINKKVRGMPYSFHVGFLSLG